MLQQVGAALEAFVNHVGFGFLHGDDGAHVLYEIDAAFFALPALALIVAAGRAGVAHGRVAAAAEARDIANVAPAFRAFDHGRRGRVAEAQRGGGRGRGCGWFRTGDLWPGVIAKDHVGALAGVCIAADSSSDLAAWFP